MKKSSVSLLIFAVVFVVLSGTVWAYRDYRAWIALGPGGLPSTWRGWIQTTKWRMIAGDPLSSKELDRQIGQPYDNSYLGTLSSRPYPRPKIAPQPVPHRQMTEHIPESLRGPLKKLFDVRVESHSVVLLYRASYFEKHNQAVTLASIDDCVPDACASHGEIGHIHPSDGSMHMILSASDAKHVLEWLGRTSRTCRKSSRLAGWIYADLRAPA